MFNSKKLKIANVALILVTAVVFFSAGYLFTKTEETAREFNKIEVQKEIDGTLTNSLVKDFITTYYTKEQLGSNREQYKPFVTKKVLNSITNEEDNSYKNMTKGFYLDYSLENVDIFINQDKKEALVTVKYKFTAVRKENDRNSEKIDVKETVQHKLKYIEVDGKLLIDEFENAVIRRYQEGKDTYHHNLYI